MYNPQTRKGAKYTYIEYNCRIVKILALKNQSKPENITASQVFIIAQNRQKWLSRPIN
jgi:hypothetical protein